MSKHTDGAIITAQDQEPSHYARIPKMATVDLDPYELALYCHYKQTASDHGTCYKSNTTLANETGMSIRKIQDTRQALADKGFISITYKRDENGIINSPPTITICNIWAENHARFHAGGMHLMQGGMQDVQGGYAPDAPKEEPIKEEPKKNDKRKRSRLSFTPRQYTPSKAASPRVYQIVKHWLALNNPASFYADETEKPAQALLDAGYSPETIATILDWKASQQYLPTLKKVCTEIGAWIKEYERRAKSKPAPVPTNGTTAAPELKPIIPDVMDGHINLPVQQYESEF